MRVMTAEIYCTLKRIETPFYLEEMLDEFSPVLKTYEQIDGVIIPKRPRMFEEYFL